MRLQRRLIFVLLVYQKRASILTRPLHDIKNASRLAPCLFLKLAEGFNYFFFMSGFYRHMYCQNQHFNFLLARADLVQKSARAFLEIQ